MDVDRRSPGGVPVDDAHPFDLDSYIAGYSGQNAVSRLRHIASVCPTLAKQAYARAAQTIHDGGREPQLYIETIKQHNAIPGGDALHIDQSWVDQTNARNRQDANRLEVEFKTYSANMIKESIRMACRDLAIFYGSIGDSQTALKHYVRSREFSTTPNHLVEMSVAVLKLLIDTRNYNHIPTYVFKADSALDNAANSAAASEKTAGTQTAVSSKKNPERDVVQTKLDYASALACLGVSTYDKAAQAFVRLGDAKGLGDWVGSQVQPSDIAIYSALTVLATQDRSVVKQLFTSSPYVGQEAYVSELLSLYLNSNFAGVLALLERYSTRHLLDVYLAPHVAPLVEQIRNRALVLYFKPFKTVRFDGIAGAFGLPINEIEALVKKLILQGDIPARIDTQNKMLRAKDVDPRTAIFTRAMETGAAMQSANRKLLLRMHLYQADLIVKHPKGHHGSSGIHPSDLMIE